MAEWNRDRINPSLLDRLTDEGPSAAGGRGGSTSLSELRRSVLRDLTWLFNTTQLFDAESAEAWPQVRKSVLNYGLPPLAGMHASALDINRLERALRQAIVDFEPRILPDSVSVKAELERETLDHHNVVSLRIAALLWAQPLPVRVYMKTEIDLEIGDVRVVAGPDAGAR